MANQHLKDNTLIERYLLKQLKDDELLEFRGAMMFDEELRKRVFQEKQLFHGLQTLSQNPEFALTVPRTKTLNLTRRWLLSTAAVALIGLAGFLVYQQVSPVQPSRDMVTADQPTTEPTAPKIEGAILTPLEETQETVTPDNATNEREQTNPLRERKSPVRQRTTVPAVVEPVVPPVKPENIIKNTEVTEEVEEIPFATANPSLNDDIINIDEEEFAMGVANTIAAAEITVEDLENLYSTHPYLEEYTDSAVRSDKGASDGVAFSTDFEDSRILKISQAQTVLLKFGVTAQTAKNSSDIGTYTIKVFSNRLEDYIENKSLLEKEITFSSTKTINFNQELSLVEGLYYFTIENNEDMKYTGKFYVIK